MELAAIRAEELTSSKYLVHIDGLPSLEVECQALKGQNPLWFIRGAPLNSEELNKPYAIKEQAFLAIRMYYTSAAFQFHSLTSKVSKAFDSATPKARKKALQAMELIEVLLKKEI